MIIKVMSTRKETEGKVRGLEMHYTAAVKEKMGEKNIGVIMFSNGIRVCSQNKCFRTTHDTFLALTFIGCKLKYFSNVITCGLS